ncbi:hypothetical protein SELMODRAFT_409108 [Selaginella moellendorffii]|uniref:Protein kinase domain-containing protein n=1 Tax=Selaginella moellendorffii TaxID=88036 RepID=D8RAE0_SELML|nr:hypothetical protein SELMODRAFT_409108 [Selaginella moellendorffii]
MKRLENKERDTSSVFKDCQWYSQPVDLSMFSGRILRAKLLETFQPSRINVYARSDHALLLFQRMRDETFLSNRRYQPGTGVFPVWHRPECPALLVPDRRARRQPRCADDDLEGRCFTRLFTYMLVTGTSFGALVECGFIIRASRVVESFKSIAKQHREKEVVLKVRDLTTLWFPDPETTNLRKVVTEVDAYKTLHKLQAVQIPRLVSWGFLCGTMFVYVMTSDEALVPAHEALATMHARGVIHGDLSPLKILLGPRFAEELVDCPKIRDLLNAYVSIDSLNFRFNEDVIVEVLTTLVDNPRFHDLKMFLEATQVV